jgi:hypothetical protein
MMKKILFFLVLILPLVSQAGDYESTLLVQTGQLRESDLIVRTVTDLESNKICLAFYVRTMGTSPVMSCYDAISGFYSKIRQVGHFKEGKLVVRKLKDTVNDVSCLVAYVSMEGTSPAIDCYKSSSVTKDAILREEHLSEGDLDVYRIVDPDSTKTCLIAYVSVSGTSPSLSCYTTKAGGKGGMQQKSFLREGDLIVRKIADGTNSKECLISYVSTQGTSPYIYCSDEFVRAKAPPAATGKQSATSAPVYDPNVGYKPVYPPGR